MYTLTALCRWPSQRETAGNILSNALDHKVTLSP